VRFWNIRAADIQLYFVDLVHLPRYAAVMPELGRRYRAKIVRTASASAGSTTILGTQAIWQQYPSPAAAGLGADQAA
jgi:hypothetical protein